MHQTILLLGNRKGLHPDERSIIEEITGTEVVTPESEIKGTEQITEINPLVVIFAIPESPSPDTISFMTKIITGTRIPLIAISEKYDDDIFRKIQAVKPHRYFIRPFSEMQLACSVDLMRSDKAQSKKARYNTCYYTIFEQLKVPMFVCDTAGTIQQVNHALEVLLSTDRSELKGQCIKQFFNDIDNYNQLISSIKKMGQCNDYISVIMGYGGEKIECSITASELFDSEFAYSGYYGIIKNIDRQKQADLDKDLLIEKLGESVLKLRCLYSLSEMMMEPHVEMDDILRDISDKINYSTHNPDRLGVRISYFDREFLSDNYKQSNLKIQSDIVVNNEKAGSIELSYIHDNPYVRTSLSFREDKNLIKAIAERIGAIAERIETLKELEQTNNELRNMSDYLRTVREEERKKISREIHDELGQALTGIRMGIVWLILKLDESREIREEKLASMLRIVEGTIDAVRKIASELRPGILDNLGLVSAVEWLADEIENRSSIKCSFSTEPEEITVSENLKVNIFRIIQEATTNTIRYAKAKNIIISLEQTDEIIEIRIKDDGCGISPDSISDSYSYGIIGMRERTKSMNGTFSIKGIPEEGTMIKITVPYETDKLKPEEDYQND